MKKILTLIFTVCLIVSSLFTSAQDKLYFLNGDETEVKVTEVTSAEIKYKRMDNLDGPTFSTLKSELFMIKYANGSKEMITAESAEPSVSPAPSQEQVTNDNPIGAPSSGSGLSSGVTISNEPAPTSNSNVDKWGRSADENMRLHKKKLITGGVVLGVGTAMLIPGVVLFARAVQIENIDSGSGDNLRISGGILTIGGFAMVIAGAAVMGSSGKYKKRANELANSRIGIDPILLNDFEYAGANIRTNSGAGFKLTYRF